MPPTLRIDLTAPPFAGHLFALLAIGRRLRDEGHRVRVLTTEAGQAAVAASGLEGWVLLPGRDRDVEAIANPPHRVKSNPFRLADQLERNLRLMRDLQLQLRQLWAGDRPDLLIADSVLPLAGWLAAELGVPWWTSITTPCAIENRRGTPAYLGGWTPRPGFAGAVRDATGRAMVRLFKTLLSWRFRRRFLELGIKGLYRPDGTEAVYSPEKILAFGMREFEFDRDWPEALEFIGYPLGSPDFSHPASAMDASKPHILVSLGTHLPWAKEPALRLIRDLADSLPDVRFHFSLGHSGGRGVRMEGLVEVHDYIPYDERLSRYRAAIIHGGSGVLHACLSHGLPVLVWPHDYDQFDHAARLVDHGLGLRLSPQMPGLAAQVRRLLGDPVLRENARRFQAELRRHDPLRRVSELVRARFPG